ncbi:TonB-dependent receptor [Stakelama tenebrarum]|uniref:TonB-dependent receptor n=1 Tax=Stakelama tenebrarum TaxID=2711215 RepID=A0A6G6Y9P2_9SPHN|nr:TonB-dependent receptor [Sphingosinithalassobacter tenebrarum]QIG81527.1 TonB-dependent receptor [Sphingosinithalassobacter tenebrarum]
MKKHLLLAWTAMPLIGVAMPAFAQDAPTESRVHGQEIVVTAQKREESMLDVPVSISVVDGEAMQAQGATSLTDYSSYVPGMQVTSSGTPGLASISLRGISATTSAAAVGFYIDDAPVGSSSLYARATEMSLDLLPYDIERIEVLRGPQGTLYGASAIGGLVKYVTVQPSLSEFGVRGGGEIFTIDGAADPGWAGQVMANAPLVEGRLGITGSFAWRKSPGYVDSVNNAALDDQNDYEQRGGRVSLLFQATDNFSISLNGIWQATNAESNGSYAADLSGDPLGNGTSFNNYVAEPFNASLDYYAATLDYDLGGVALTSVTTYSERHIQQVRDTSHIYGALFPLLTGGAIPAGVTPYDNTVALEKWTQEVRLASTGEGAFEWLIGGFYTHEDSTQDQTIRPYDMAGNLIPALDPLAIVELPATYEEYAVFGNATLHLGDMFAITGGVRWAKNEQSFRQASYGSLVPVADDPGESSEDVVTFSVSPQVFFGDDAMLYARVATGYRPGGPNVIVPGVPPTVDSDTVTNYEVGFKGALADGLITIDAALFYMDWQDIQVAMAFGGIGGIGNGGSAESKGAEGSVVIAPVAGLTIGFTAAYTDATLTEDVPSISGLDGDRLPEVPEFSGSARLDYSMPVGIGDTLDFGIGVRHASSRFSLVESDPLRARAKPYTTVDANIGYTFDGHWTLRAYVRNALNDEGELGRTLFTDGLNIPSYLAISPVQPRTFGLAADVAF